MIAKIKGIIQESINIRAQLLDNEDFIGEIVQLVQELVLVFDRKQKVLFCGNGGSAADAQHLATELSGRFYLDRAPLFAEALGTNPAFTTAVGNDYDFSTIFSRAVRAKGQPGDALVALSTSGNSPNVLKALKTARELGMITVGLTGQSGGQMVDWCDYLIKIPSNDTPRIQEGHILVGHIICQLIEEILFEEENKCH